MSYQHVWGGVIPTSYFRIHDCGIQGCPGECSAHEPYCFKAEAPVFTRKAGHISLIDPVNINQIQGTKANILELSIKALITNLQWGYIIQSNEIKIIVDGVEAFKRSITHSSDDWKLNKWAVNKDITNANLIDLDLYMDADAGIGWVTLHNTEIILLGDYWDEIIPPTASVELTVINKSNSKPIDRVRVILMVGTTIKADGYTNSSGNITFENMDEGSYMADVIADGYSELNQAITVKAPASKYVIKLVPIPVTPTPDWVWYVVGGVTVLGVAVTIPAIIKSRKKEEKYIVVR